MIETKLYLLHDRTIVEAETAQPCPMCNVAKYFFVNQNGASTCWQCADVNVLTQGGATWKLMVSFSQRKS